MKCEHCKINEHTLEPCFGRYKAVCDDCSDKLRTNKLYRLGQEIHYRFHYIYMVFRIIFHRKKKKPHE
jgi:hypothetical protein